MRRHRFLPAAVVAAAAAPAGLVLLVVGADMVMPPMWVHFYGVGGTALVATAAAVALTRAGVRAGDARSVAMAVGFSLMAAILAAHGFVTPGVVLGMTGLPALTGAATLPVGAAVLVAAGMPRLASPRVIPALLATQVAGAAVIVGVSLLGALVPSVVPAVPAARSPEALALLAFGLVLFVALALRAARTFLLTRRSADLAVVVGIALLGNSLVGALALDFMQLGWWLGHVFEFVGIAVVGGSVAYDLRRGRRSRALVGDLRAVEVVAAEEAFLGARVRALMVRLAEKDSYTEQHTRRVATLAVELGEELGLPPTRLRTLAIGGLLHDIGKLSVPNAVLKKPAALDDDEYATIKRHPQDGHDLLGELGGFDDGVRRLVLDHHERLDGGGYPRGLRGEDLDVATRILAVCDVYDALVSARVYRGAWPAERALALLRDEAGTAFDERVVDALVRVLERAPADVAAPAQQPHPQPHPSTVPLPAPAA